MSKASKAETRMAPKLGNPTSGGPRLVTNVYGVKVQQNAQVFRYDVIIKAELASGRVIEFSRRARGE